MSNNESRGRSFLPPPHLPPLDASFLQQPAPSRPTSINRFPVRPQQPSVGDTVYQYESPASYGQYNPYEAEHRSSSHLTANDTAFHTSTPYNGSLSRSTSRDTFLKLQTPIESEPTLPKWPGILRTVLRVTIVLISAAMSALTIHAISIYTRTRGFGISGGEDGTMSAWPANLSLTPENFLVSIAVMSFLIGLVQCLVGIRKRFDDPVRSGDAYAIGSGVFFLGAWVASAVLAVEFSGQEGRTGLRWYACENGESDADRIVGYSTVCTETSIAQYFGIGLIALELLWLLAFGATTYYTRKAKKNSFRVRGMVSRWST